MKQNSKKENKICFILDTITSCLFLVTGISNIVAKGSNMIYGITNIALSITFGCLAFMYFKKYKSIKKEEEK